MQLNIRQLLENDYSTLKTWWDKWSEWTAPSKEFLPENGTGGFIVEINN